MELKTQQDKSSGTHQRILLPVQWLSLHPQLFPLLQLYHVGLLDQHDIERQRQCATERFKPQAWTWIVNWSHVSLRLLIESFQVVIKIKRYSSPFCSTGCMANSVSYRGVSLDSGTTGWKVKISVKVWPKDRGTAGQWSIKQLISSYHLSPSASTHHWLFLCLLFDSLKSKSASQFNILPFILTFPLAEGQVCVVQRVVVRLCLCLLLWFSELTEVRQSESLCSGHPALRIQQQHAFQHRHSWGQSWNRKRDSPISCQNR